MELRSENGFRRFKIALENLKIPYEDYNGNLDYDLEKIFSEIFQKEV